MKILCFETSSVASSVAIFQDEKIISEFFLNNKLVHSKTFMPMVKNVLEIADIKIDDIDVIAVSTGPGSFTGLRIGISTAKGIAAKNNTPCLSVSTLESCAYNLVNNNGIICPVMDARRNEVYNAVFECENGMIKRLCDDRAISIADLETELKKYKDKNIFIVGDGADLCYNIFENKDNIHLPAENSRYQRAAGVGLCALEILKCCKTIKSSELTPIYLKLPQAERELLERQKNNIEKPKGAL